MKLHRLILENMKVNEKSLNHPYPLRTFTRKEGMPEKREHWHLAEQEHGKMATTGINKNHLEQITAKSNSCRS